MREGEGANKRDFLKVLGAGLGIAGLGATIGGQSLRKKTRKSAAP